MLSTKISVPDPPRGHLSNRGAIWALAAVFLWASIANAHAQNAVAKPGLQVFIDGSFRSATFSDIELNAPGMLCIRYNNYWCIKSVGWEGEVGKDTRGHAVFNDPVYAARAVARQFRTWWFRDNRRTAFDIMSAYAPPNDCVGSVGKPPNCKYGRNPTEAYATRIAFSIGKGLRDNLELFDSKGKLDRKVAIPLFQAIAKFEITEKYEVSGDLIESGIDRAGL